MTETDDHLKQIELMKNIFVEKSELQTILDRHGEKTGNTIYSQLAPELQGIQRELEHGHEKFEKQDEKIEAIKVECAGNHPKSNSSGSHGDLDKEEQVIHKRAKVYIAIAVSIFAVVVVMVGGAMLILNSMGVF